MNKGERYSSPPARRRALRTMIYGVVLALSATAAPPRAAGHSQHPTPPSVPNEYSQHFWLSDGSDGVLHYDWMHRRQRISHTNNTASRRNQCYFWFNETGPCVEYFTEANEQYVYFPDKDTCCLESCADKCPPWKKEGDGSCCREASVGLPRPDSAAQCTYNSTVSWEGQKVYWFSCPACLNYYFDIQLNARLFWTDNHLYAVRFDVPSLRPAPQPASLFTLPKACTPSVKCKGFVASPSIVC